MPPRKGVFTEMRACPACAGWWSIVERNELRRRDV